jgi:hypothetical protein
LDFGIRLDKFSYEGGETAMGTLLTKANRSLKIRKPKFAMKKVSIV